MVSKILKFGNQKGSFLNFSAHGWWGKEKNLSAEKNRAKPEKQKGKKEGGLGEGIFALLRFKLERFQFPLIKRKPKQKFFQILLPVPCG